MPAGRPAIKKNNTKVLAQSRFIKQFSSITMVQLCEEMYIERKNIYDGKVSKEKAYWVANRLIEKVFIMFVDYYVATGQDLSTLHRVELDWHNKAENLKIIKSISSISPHHIGARLGIRTSNCANARTSADNIELVFDILYEKLKNVAFTEV